MGANIMKRSKKNLRMSLVVEGVVLDLNILKNHLPAAIPLRVKNTEKVALMKKPKKKPTKGGFSLASSPWFSLANRTPR